MPKRLCDRCEQHSLVKSHESGVVLDYCDFFNVSLSKLGEVKECTSFANRELPWLFAKTAWEFSKDKKGKITFKKPA